MDGRNESGHDEKRTRRKQANVSIGTLGNL